MTTTYESQISAIAYKASQLGAQGYRVTAVIMPTSATQSEPLFVIDKPESTGATEKPWYE
jgi:hypothetical protein